MPSMILTLHGTGAGTPSGDRMASALTARFTDGSVVLFDAGEACARAMIRDGVDVNRITTVAISHMHADHWAGIPGLITGWATLGRGRDTVVIRVPEGLVPFFESAQIQSLFFPEGIDFAIDWRELEPFDMPDGWRVELFTTTHLTSIEERAAAHGVVARAMGYLLRNGERRIVLSQDIGAASDLAGPIDRAELLVCESAHVEPEEILTMARDAGVGRVIFTHVSPKGKRRFPDRFHGIEWSVAVDGMRVEIA
jgi:ribonuclease BN (tRNA processing enzyme)